MSFIIALLAPKVGELAARAIVYAVLAALVAGTLLGIRQHYVNLGWYKHKAAIERQDNRAIDASKQVEEKTSTCSEKNGYWDVITQGCKIGDDDAVTEEKK